MNRRSLKYLTLLSLLSTLLLAPTLAFAADEEEEETNTEPSIEEIETAAKPPSLTSNVFNSGSIVRRKLLYRSTRFEAVPFFGLTVNDGFNRNLMPGISLSYHLTNDLGIAASFAYGVYQWDTSLKDHYIDALKKVGKSGDALLAKTDFTKLQFFADLGLSYVPMYGKFSLFGAATVAWDLHLVGGVAVIMQQAYNVDENKDTSNSPLAGIKPGGLLQIGTRLYFNDFISLNLDVRNLIYASSDYTVSNEENSKLTDRVFVSLGIGFFFPTDVKVSW